jgi:endonuclease YncB( thermonuclease family)
LPPTLRAKLFESWTATPSKVLHGKHPERIRLYGIDCPEKGQSFGQNAKQATSSLLFGKDVRIESHGRDNTDGLWEPYSTVI